MALRVGSCDAGTSVPHEKEPGHAFQSVHPSADFFQTYPHPRRWVLRFDICHARLPFSHTIQVSKDMRRFSCRKCGIDWRSACISYELQREAPDFEGASAAEGGHVTGKSVSPGSGRKKRIALLACGLLVLSLTANAADLKPETQAAFHRYVQLTEAQIGSADARGEPFLWIDRQTPQRRTAIYAELRAGNAAIERLDTFDGNGKPVSVSGGLVHHWIGTVFIPGATLAQTLDFEKDYDHQARNFQPHVQRSQILSHDGENYEVLLRLREKKVITVVLDTVHEIQYMPRDATHTLSRSYTSRIQEVDHPGEADESLEPAGHDDGFLWAMNTYWR